MFFKFMFHIIYTVVSSALSVYGGVRLPSDSVWSFYGGFMSPSNAAFVFVCLNIKWI